MTACSEVFCFVVLFDRHTEDDKPLFWSWLFPLNRISHALKRFQNYDLDGSVNSTHGEKCKYLSIFGGVKNNYLKIFLKDQ